jgi:phenylpyruvate tautomerase PptA (4-oxalocrotonate tautomerase family)
MPLVRIDVIEGHPQDYVRQIADAIHHAIVAEYGIPERDRFQIITEKTAAHVIAEDAGLGFERSDDVVMIQIFTQRGRSVEVKQRLYATMAEALGALGISGENVFIGYVENGPEDWSFGYGRAQYMTGELAVPEVARVAA